MEVPKVFISYSHDSPEHAERVLALSDRLRQDGIDCHIDQYEVSPPEGWPRWMLNKVEWADFVLVVCTEAYNLRFWGKAPSGEGKGVKWQGAILTQELYETEAHNTRFIPVMFFSHDISHVPLILRGQTCYDISTDTGYEEFYRRLTNQRRVIKPPPGQFKEYPTGINMEDNKYDDSQGSVALKTDRTEIELTIDCDFDSYTEKEKRRLLDAIGNLLEVSDLKIKRIKRGSIKMSLELTPEQAERLFWEVKAGALEEYGVVNAELKESQETLKREDKSLWTGLSNVERADLEKLSQKRSKTNLEKLSQKIDKENKNLKPTEPPPSIQLRSEPIENFSTDEVEKMLKEMDFFDIKKNKQGKGLSHQYELVEKEGEKLVIDHTTGLTWQQSGSFDYDHTTGLTWQQYQQYCKAKEYIKQLNTNRFAGYNDWRLPTLEEAMSLMEPESKNGDLYISEVFDRSHFYIWTSDKKSSSAAWVVYFGLGSCNDSHVGFYYERVRAVR